MNWGIIASLWHDPVFSGWAWVSSLGIMVYMRWAHKARMRDRQKEIDRIAQENREYRTIFTEFLRDKMQSIKTKRPRAKK